MECGGRPPLNVMKRSVLFIIGCLIAFGGYVMQTALKGDQTLAVGGTDLLSAAVTFAYTLSLLFLMGALLGQQAQSSKIKMWLCLCVGSALFEFQRLITVQEPYIYGFVSIAIAFLVGWSLLHITGQAADEREGL